MAFTDINVNLTGVYNGSVATGDYDGNRNLNQLITKEGSIGTNKSASTQDLLAKTTLKSQILVFIDAGVEDYQFLAQGVIPEAKAFILDRNRDGIKQITETLSEYPNVDSIHLISHGSPGSLQLGNAYLSLDTLAEYRAELQTWSAKSLLLYGCNVAAGDAGTELIEKLHQLTGLDIAASRTKTGSSILGGDWNLEVNLTARKSSNLVSGKSLIFDSDTIQNYQWVLDPVSLSSQQTLTGAGASWLIQNNSVYEASYNNGSTTQYDAFDDALRFSVDGSRLSFPDSADLTGSTLTTSPVSASGLNINAQYYADRNQPTLRTFLSLENPTAAPITVTLTLQTNMGSDSGTSVQATSSGDTNFTVADRWVITDDSPTGGDPTNTHVLTGPDNPTVTPTSVSQTVFSNAGTEGILSEYSVTIPANSTSSLLFFNSLSDTSANAQTNVAVFNDVTALKDTTLLDGLTNQQLNETLNWEIPVTANNDTANTNEDTVLSVAAPGVLANDIDPENDPLTVTNFDATSTSGATVTVSGDGSYSYDPTAAVAIQALDAGDTFDDTFTYTVDDGNSNIDTATVTVTVNGVNDAPVLDTEIPDRNINNTDPLSIDISGNFSDVDADDTLSYSASGLPTGLSIDAATGEITGTLTESGSFPITITAEDIATESVSDTFNITSNTGRDTLEGTATDETLDGGESNDTLGGSLGADSLVGGDGMDRVIYRASDAGVQINLTDNTATGGDAEGDSFNSIENLDGSNFGDSLTGDANNNRIYGGKDNDTIAGAAGADYLSGQNGDDSIAGGAEGDRLVGGNGNDTLSGDGGDDILLGGNGDDSLTGADTTTNGVGEIDRLTGGNGADVFVLGTTATAFYDDGDSATDGIDDYAVIFGFDPAVDRVELSATQTYYLDVNPTGTLLGTGVFIDSDSSSSYTTGDELVGLLADTTLTAGQITASTAGFSLV